MMNRKNGSISSDVSLKIIEVQKKNFLSKLRIRPLLVICPRRSVAIIIEVSVVKCGPSASVAMRVTGICLCVWDGVGLGESAGVGRWAGC